MAESRGDAIPWLGRTLGAVLLLLFALPLLALLLSTSPAQLSSGLSHPRFGPALLLSLRSTIISFVAIVVLGTPLAWWLARSRRRRARVIELLVNLPIVVPPAVVGVGLLQAFGRRGLFGEALAAAGLPIVFTEVAVVLAQVVVAGPFYVQAAATAFRKVDSEMLAVARTLGASPRETFARVAVPIALPGLVTGASLAWARSLGEFGATLLFAGNFPGKTQTLPLAIFSALESDLSIAVAFSLALVAVGALLLGALHLLARRGSMTEADHE